MRMFRLGLDFLLGKIPDHAKAYLRLDLDSPKGTPFSNEFNFGRVLGITSFRFMCADAHALLRPAHRRCRRLLAARQRARHRAQHPACARCTSPAAPARARALALSAVR